MLAPIAATAVALGIVAPAPARAADFPQGSYQKTCSNIHWGNPEQTLLRGFCSPKASDTAAAESSINVLGCAKGSISNLDGGLVCTNNGFLKFFKNSNPWRPIVRAAAAITIGHMPDDLEYLKWIKFGQAHSQWTATINDGSLDFTTAAAILRAYLVEAATQPERHAVYVAAYRNVWGKDPGVIDISGYDAKIKAGKSWYSTIVGDEHKAKNAPAPKPTFPDTSATPPPPIH